MIYLHTFYLPGESLETKYEMGYHKEFEMSCYSRSGYPFGLFPLKKLDYINFTSSVTIFSGENGSGKSTLLNVIADTIGANRFAPYNKSNCFDAFVNLCNAYLNPAPMSKLIITSDSIFDFLLDMRFINEGLHNKREKLFNEYEQLLGESEEVKLWSTEEYDKFKEVRHTKPDKYVRKRLGKDYIMASNGESALDLFESRIDKKMICLLDEPENSLSALHQKDLAQYISDSARFFDCQFIIATHSPFILSINGATVYDLDAYPVDVKKWTELNSIKEYRKLFKDID